MKKRVLLTTICSSGQFPVQLALYNLKAYFIKHSLRSKSVTIYILSFLHSQKIKSVIKQIKKRKPHIVGFSCYVWNIISILKVARAIKKDMPDIKIVLGGPEASPRAYQLMRNYNFIDVVVIGEGEKTFKELLEYWLGNKTDICNINGIAYRKKGKVILTQKRQQITNLDEIPSPYLEKIISDKLMKSYCANYRLPMETMRGCQYKCHFCYDHKGFGEISYYSLNRVGKELEYLLRKGPQNIYLMDSTFNWNRKRAKEILRIIIKYNKKTKLLVELRAELLDQEMVDLLYKANAEVDIGIQSTNKKTLELMNRTFNPDKFKKNILLLNKKGVTYAVQLIDCLPGETYESSKKSINWLLKLRVGDFAFLVLQVLPGTYLRSNAGYFGIKYMRQAPYYRIKSDTFSTKDLKKIHRLGMAIYVLWFLGLMKKSLYLLAKKLSLDFSKIFEEWDYWTNEARYLLIRLLAKEKNIKRKRTIDTEFIIKMAISTINFVKYLAQKYNKSDLVKQISGSVRQDREIYFKNIKKGLKKKERLMIDRMIRRAVKASNKFRY